MKSETEKRREFNHKLFKKIIDFIEYFYHGIYEKSKEDYIKENEDKFKLLKNKQNFIEDYNSWFLLKQILPNKVSVIQMAESFPENYFNKEEKEMLDNLLNYRESLFEIINISKDHKIYTIKDVANNEIFLIKTFNLPDRFNKSDLIRTLIVKDLDKNYFFFGAIQSFDIINKKEFIKEVLIKLKLENTLRESIKGEIVDWKIENWKNKRKTKKEKKQ